MPLTELIVDGFKSFPDKTSIHFGRGITGIVGPNGSGKSNITEAIRWAMGEGSAKSLRGSNMKDVIFAGSELRKPLNRAQVTLVFDNKKRELALDEDQVSVSREIFGSGENHYYINKKSVRLKDVRALFLDSGISENGLAIISQGRVDQILNSKPEERRSLFEEAAGVLHFKRQKEEAAAQLTKTNANLIRINDLVNELKKRLNPLAEQSSAAKDYQYQKTGLARHLKTLLAFQIQNLARQKQTLKDQAVANQQLLRKLDQEVSQSQKAVASKKKMFAAMSQKRTALQAKLLKITRSLADLKTQLQVREQSRHYNQATSIEYQKQLVDLQSQGENLQAELIHLNKQKAALKEQEQDLGRQRQQLQKKFKQNPAQLEQALEQKRDQYIELLQEQTSNNNHLLYLRTELKRSQKDGARKNNELDEQLKDAQASLLRMAKKGKQLRSEFEEKNKLFSRRVKQGNKRKAKIAVLRRQVNSARDHLQRCRARREALLNIQKRHEGYYSGVRNILNRKQQYPGVIGAVGELLSFPFALQAAMTTALGGSVQDLVVKTRNDARDCINQLKRRRAGRATFLPLDSLFHHSVPTSTIFSLQAIPGFKGLASKLVASQSNEEIKPVIDYLLGSVLIVDTIETALLVQKRTRRYRIVTLDGDVIAPGGSMTGGVRNERGNSPLRITADINQLTGQVTKAQQKFATVSEQLKLLLHTDAEQQAKLDAARSDLQTAKEDLGKAALSYQNQNKEVKRLADANQLLHSEKQEREQHLQELEKQMKQAGLDQHELEQRADTQKKAIAEIQAQLENSKQVQQKKQQVMAKLEPAIAVVKNKLANLVKLQAERQNQLNASKKQATTIKEKIASLTDNGQSSEKGKAKLQDQSSALTAKRDKIQQEVEQQAANLGQVSAQIDQLNQIAARNYQLRKDAAEEQESYSVKIAKLNEKINHRLDQLRQKYALTYEAALSQAQLKNTAANRASLAKKVKLHRLSLADIGPVNLDAISEYKSVKKRTDFLVRQQNDLIQARKNLRSSLHTLDDEVKKRFAASFDKIASSFAHIFPLVFNGGKAQLVLTAPDDLLTTGIEIIAQPPGKKLQRLSLLSGGERALTAITLLFAMLQVNPVPFCVLDEVEAALDEANVARFADFLQKYDLHTQFIVITHRRGTMARADQLFGVVMQESGVSQILSVSLREMKNEVKE